MSEIPTTARQRADRPGTGRAAAPPGPEDPNVPMQLVQTRLVTEDVNGLAAFYARLVGVPVVLNDYYVEVGMGAVSIGFSRCRYTEFPERDPRGREPGPRDHVVLDIVVDDVDGHFGRVDDLGVEWVLPPTTQPWGARSMVFRDPDGHLVNLFSRPDGTAK
ncbi:MAG TPA: VOC family protein [Acidimicrobiales bacterium]|jgi:catechol 2,3-dioxygenase-like lactoylglutathione lyase family enzyme|nr:VOC family protein [Acidimicrobiales bacterium]